MREPFYFQWHITNLCNLRCQHCYQEDFSKKEDLDGPGLKRISDNVLATLEKWDQRACIHLTGGEPFLKPELFLLLQDLDQEPGVEELGLITNGTCFDRESVKKLLAFSKLKKIKISLDGANARTNDAIRHEGNFEKVIRNLPLIKKENRFEIILMFTVMKKNFTDLLSLIHLCQDLDVDGLILERFVPWGRGRDNRDEVLEKEQWKELVETLLKYFSTETDEDSLYPFQAYQVTFKGDETELMGAPCVIGRDGLCIMPDGRVLPCRRFPISIGNLLDDSLELIWEKSELLANLRKKENLKGKCGRCGIKDCMGCRSLALSLTGDCFGEDPHCGYQPETPTGC